MCEIPNSRIHIMSSWFCWLIVFDGFSPMYIYIYAVYWYTVCILYIPYIQTYLYKVYSIGTSPSYVGFLGLVVQPTGKVCQSAFAKTAELNSGKRFTRKQLRYWAEANASFFSSNRFRNGFYPYVSWEKQHVTWVLSLIGGSRVTQRQSLFSHLVGWKSCDIFQVVYFLEVLDDQLHIVYFFSCELFQKKLTNRTE